MFIFSSIRAIVLMGARITCNICTYFGDKHDNDAMGVCKDVHAYICMLACYMHRERERGGLERERERGRVAIHLDVSTDFIAEPNRH